jgi:hypothetical protein
MKYFPFKYTLYKMYNWSYLLIKPLFGNPIDYYWHYRDNHLGSARDGRLVSRGYSVPAANAGSLETRNKAAEKPNATPAKSYEAAPDA